MDDTNPGEYWQQYGLLTRFAANKGTTIQRRHEFFARKMHQLLSPELKDPARIFGTLERELIYFREKKRCQVCDAEVAWSDHEIHHVVGHAKGGMTVMDNGALVHKHCHPKGKAADEFAAGYGARRGTGSAT